MSEGSPIFSKTDAVPVANVGAAPALNRVTCVATLYHVFNGQQPAQFDLHYGHQITEPEQAYVRERTLGAAGPREHIVGLDYLAGKVGGIVIQNMAGPQTMSVQPTEDERAIIANTVLKVTMGGLVFLVRPGRFMLFELYDDTSVTIKIEPQDPQYPHPFRLIGLPR
jgi:hypothetical protein